MTATDAEIEAAVAEFGRWTLGLDTRRRSGISHFVLRIENGVAEEISQHPTHQEAEAACFRAAVAAALKAAHSRQAEAARLTAHTAVTDERVMTALAEQIVDLKSKLEKCRSKVNDLQRKAAETARLIPLAREVGRQEAQEEEAVRRANISLPTIACGDKP